MKTIKLPMSMVSGNYIYFFLELELCSSTRRQGQKLSCSKNHNEGSLEILYIHPQRLCSVLPFLCPHTQFLIVGSIWGTVVMLRPPPKLEVQRHWPVFPKGKGSMKAGIFFFFCLFWSQWCFWCLEECLTHSRCSINISKIERGVNSMGPRRKSYDIYFKISWQWVLLVPFNAKSLPLGSDFLNR